MTAQKSRFGLMKSDFFEDNDVMAIHHSHASDDILMAMVHTSGMVDCVIEIDPFLEAFEKQKAALLPADAGLMDQLDVHGEFSYMPSETFTSLCCHYNLELNIEHPDDESLDIDGETPSDCYSQHFKPGKSFLKDEFLHGVLLSMDDAIAELSELSGSEKVHWAPAAGPDEEEDEGGYLLTDDDQWREFSEMNEKCPYVLFIRGEKSNVRRAFFLVGDLSLFDTIWQAWCDAESASEEDALLREFVDNFDKAAGEGRGQSAIMKNAQMKGIVKAFKKSADRKDWPCRD